MAVFRTKSIEQSLADTDEPEYSLKKNLSALDLTVFGIGVVIGAGIFTLTGKAAATMAGPAIVISFVISAVACALAAVCYAEFASTVPVSGSAYTFSYASLGEIIAWIIGWDLILELLVGAANVAQGWSAYVIALLDQAGITFPKAIGNEGGFNLLAVLLVAALSVLITIGVKESLRVNMVLVAVKLFIVVFVIVAGLFFVRASNYSPFIPPTQPGDGETGLTQPLIQAVLGLQPTAFGVGGIFAGAALVFFAYIGFDVVATTAEEARNPQRDLPIGIIASLTICTVLYAAVCLVITGMVKYDRIDPSAALAKAFSSVGQGWMAVVISAGAVAGLTTVVLTLLTGAARVVFAMSRDHLLPPTLSKVHPRFKTPYVITAVLGVLGMLIAGFVPFDALSEMVNIGTLTAFILVSIGVIVLRRTRPDLKRAFRVPGVPVVPALAALVCFYLTINLSVETWIRFLVWMAVGFVIYAIYGYRKARLGTGETLQQMSAEHGLHAETDTKL
ncbi:APA family basic amino acid/polyamine antiporter [Friedmanniella endophytica]|uniref:APA family basic amino acid/polyamine antiporter n=1 Tax=Microlunatus kandeliicorticis TaxID=1759536 RepID=A0A7W3P7H4_9ACTN|nr:amino acid permease [Microlunatus kandeliicorticis]MBA8796033.1 APA family basic amino acid/polyamine antiporter [Microlunatus kandeliicorticis]